MVNQIKYITHEPLKPSQLPLVIGYFGCVHVMHQQLLTAYDQFNVLTFINIPAKEHDKIYNFGDRLNALKHFEPTNIYIFDLTTHNMSAEEFVVRILSQIKPSKILVGSDFKFGSDHKSWKLLRKYYKVETINYNKNVSTTKLCGLLKKGKVEEANYLLHSPYHYSSRWIKGHKKGRLLGARTINLLLERPILLPPGSYISKIKIGKKKYNSVSFYGQSKVTSASKPTLETHVLDKVIVPRFIVPKFIKDKIDVEFIKFIRPYKEFKTTDELSKAIKKDIEVAKEYYQHNI